MKTLAVAILLVIVMSTSLNGWHLYAQPDSYVIGGEYIIHRGEVLTGDLNALFAQVTLEEGARVEGQIRAVSTVLDLAGIVDSGILVIGGDVTVRATAALAERPRSLNAIPYVVLLPQMTRTGNAAIIAR